MLAKIDPNRIDRQLLNATAKVACAGDLIIFPTDTIYGIGTSTHSQAGIMRLYAIKKRPLTQPIGIFVDSFEMLERYCDIGQKEQDFLSSVWPGPLTCILKRKVNEIYYTTPTKTQMQTVAVRIPQNPVTRELVALMGEALLETSVNVSTQPFLLWEDLCQTYERFAQIMLSSGKETDNSPSTIIDMSEGKVKLVREGSFSWQTAKEMLIKTGLEPNEG